MPDNPNPFAPKPPKPPDEVKPEKKKEQLLKDITKILKKYNGESNVPFNHIYWEMCNRYRGLP